MAFARLPTDLHMHCILLPFSKLPEIAALSATSREWRSRLNSKQLWETLLARDFPTALVTSSGSRLVVMCYCVQSEAEINELVRVSEQEESPSCTALSRFGEHSLRNAVNESLVYRRIDVLLATMHPASTVDDGLTTRPEFELPPRFECELKLMSRLRAPLDPEVEAIACALAHLIACSWYLIAIRSTRSRSA